MYNTNHKNELLNLFNLDSSKTYSAKTLVDMYSDSMDKATIYRKLKQLESNKKIFKVFNINTNMYEYSLYESCANHMHLKCISCGKIVHLKCDVVECFISHIEREHDFVLENTNQTIYGKCKECR